MPLPSRHSSQPSRIVKAALSACLAALTAACVVIPRGPDGAPYTARLPADEQNRPDTTLTPEQRKQLGELNAKALRESDQAAEHAAQMRQYVAAPAYAPSPYFGSYPVFYGGGWRHRGSWGVGYGMPVWGTPYVW
ncbi:MULTISPECIES: hypothetical protein [Ralstonia]|uniref:hypothetical protein n=1 Tax=Ralstonia TaxID=48736 RepID=UPI0009DC437E|nr:MULTISPECIES: hypothetical protein [Ralstonia]